MTDLTNHDEFDDPTMEPEQDDLLFSDSGDDHGPASAMASAPTVGGVPDPDLDDDFDEPEPAKSVPEATEKVPSALSDYKPNVKPIHVSLANYVNHYAKVGCTPEIAEAVLRLHKYWQASPERKTERQTEKQTAALEAAARKAKREAEAEEKRAKKAAEDQLKKARAAAKAADGSADGDSDEPVPAPTPKPANGKRKRTVANKQ